MSLIYPKNVRAVEEMLNSFMPFAKERLGYSESPDIRLAKDPDNAQDPLGKTAYYEPQHKRITVYIDGRHVKDIMRSISHEMVHHAQNLRGDLAGTAGIGEQGYAQNDEHLREMEREAYEQGNLCFRDWEDGIKTGGLYEAFDRGDLISMIRDYSKDLTGSRDDYGDIEKLEKMSDEQLQAYYQGMSDSPEAQDMERRFRDEEEAEMGTDSDFDRMPKQSGMSRGLRETNMFDKRREKLNKMLMERFGYTPSETTVQQESGQHRPFQIGDYVRITDGGLRGAAGKIIELVELVTGEDGFVVLLDNPADQRVFGQAGDEVIVAADKVEPPVSAMQESGYKWDSTSELERAMSSMDKETFKQALKDVQKQLGLSDEEFNQRIIKFVNSGRLEEGWQDDPMAGVQGDEHMNQLKFTIEDVIEANPGAGGREIMQAVMAQPGIEGNYDSDEIAAAIEDFMGKNNIDIDPLGEAHNNVIDGDKPERMWSSIVDNTPMRGDAIEADKLIAAVAEENPDINPEEIKGFLDALVQQKSIRLIPDEDFGDEYQMMSEEKNLQELFGLFGDSDEVKTLNGAAQKIAQEEENFRAAKAEIAEKVKAYKEPGPAIGKLESSVKRIKSVLETYVAIASKMKEDDFKDHKRHKIVKKLRQDSDIVTTLTGLLVQDIADGAEGIIKELTRKAKMTAMYAQQDMADKDTRSGTASYTRNNSDNEFARGMFGTDDPMDVHRESLRKALKNNPELVKSIQRVGIEKIKEEMSKRDFVNQAWEKQAPSRNIPDSEIGAIESFNNWRAADPRRESDWEEAQSYRGGRVLAMHIKDSNTIDPATGRAKVIQKYYDVQKDMYLDDWQLDGILPESVKFQNVLKTKLQTIFKKHPHLAENKEFINKLKTGLKTTLTEKYKNEK